MVPEDCGSDADVLRVLDRNGSGGAVAEEMRRDGFAEGITGVLVDVIADHAIGKRCAEAGDP